MCYYAETNQHILYALQDKVTTNPPLTNCKSEYSQYIWGAVNLIEFAQTHSFAADMWQLWCNKPKINQSGSK